MHCLACFFPVYYLKRINLKESSLRMKKLVGYFTLFERLLWLCSVAVLIGSYVLEKEKNPATLVGSLVGATALIFLAKGNIWGQILTVVFSLIYGAISYRFQYYGEVITYLGMTGPIALLAIITWLRHPSDRGNKEVEIASTTPKQAVIIGGLTVVVTVLFYYLLRYWGNANLAVSTVSIATSFAASALTVVRSPYYAIAYACNDIVLIVLWGLAFFEDPSYLPVVMCFVIFLINDIYGFINWKRMHKRQNTPLNRT